MAWLGTRVSRRRSRWSAGRPARWPGSSEAGPGAADPGRPRRLARGRSSLGRNRFGHGGFAAATGGRGPGAAMVDRTGAVVEHGPLVPLLFHGDQGNLRSSEGLYGGFAV